MFEVKLTLHQNGWLLVIESQEKETTKEQHYLRKEIKCKNLEEALRIIKSNYNKD